MNPSFSVVFLTTASGAGYGMLVWLAVLNAAGALPRAAWFGLTAIALALALTIAGLLASTFHLGHPERAWRALSQWRSSWLSREGVMAIATFPPALLFALAWALFGAGADVTVALGLAAAACGALTVFAQGMIYASLKPVRQWHQGGVVPNFLLLAAFSGVVCLAGLAAFWGAFGAAAWLAIALGVAALAGKLLYWRAIDRGVPAASLASATGLGGLGPVRSLEWPHTEENYLLREMGFVIGRRHAARLRAIAVALGFLAPLALLALLPFGAAPAGIAAALVALAGIYVERWLFFAEATHTVTLYYGREG
ncbi:MAG: dimethyl sulfoxide reductase anchor subunit [Rhodospirillales bacterium]|nr:dimethyl sulfoxide reductase anchor subunit [Rhodospirillales bacterium]